MNESANVRAGTGEDEARTFERRGEVFEDFGEAVKALARRANYHGYGFDGTPELPNDWHADAAAKLTRLGSVRSLRLGFGWLLEENDIEYEIRRVLACG